MFPDCPYDASELVRHRDRGLVVHVGLGKVVRPLPQPIRLLPSRVNEQGARAVNEECAQVAIPAFGDPPKVALQAA